MAQSFQVLPPQAQTFLAQARLSDREHGALPPEHEDQFMELIYQKPTSSEPLESCSWAFRFPLLSWEAMHLQQVWDQPEYWEHADAISYMDLEVPQ